MSSIGTCIGCRADTFGGEDKCFMCRSFDLAAEGVELKVQLARAIQHGTDEEAQKWSAIAERDAYARNLKQLSDDYENHKRDWRIDLDAARKDAEALRAGTVSREHALDAIFRMSNWQHGYGQSRLATTEDCVRCLDSTHLPKE